MALIIEKWRIKLPRDEDHIDKGKVFASELGLKWEQVVAQLEISNYMRAVTLEWLYHNRGLLQFKKFRFDIIFLREVKVINKESAFLNLGYPLPSAIENNPDLFFDFWETLRSILDLIPDPDRPA